MYYRFNADNLTYEVCDSKGRVLYEVLTENEAKTIITNRGV